MFRSESSKVKWHSTPAGKWEGCRFPVYASVHWRAHTHTHTRMWWNDDERLIEPSIHPSAWGYLRSNLLSHPSILTLQHADLTALQYIFTYVLILTVTDKMELVPTFFRAKQKLNCWIYSYYQQTNRHQLNISATSLNTNFKFLQNRKCVFLTKCVSMWQTGSWSTVHRTHDLEHDGTGSSSLQCWTR